MAVKLWDLDESGHLTSSIKRKGQSGLEAEGFRPQAEDLDARIDQLLDMVLDVLGREDPNPRHNMFAKRWAIGRGIAESSILESDNLEPGERAELWRAMARKCRLGIRHDGSRDPKSFWKDLIPERHIEPKRIENDIFGIGMWLQEQDLDDARTTFGEGLHNAKQVWSGEALRSRNFRNALASYFSERGQEELEILYRIPHYTILAKALRQRWPSSRTIAKSGKEVYKDRELRYGSVRIWRRRNLCSSVWSRCRTPGGPGESGIPFRLFCG